MASRHSMDLTEGSVMKKLIQFTFPILLSSLLQQFYSAADTIVVGQFAEKQDLAAVGSTGSISALILTLFMGLATGVNIVTSQLYGSRKREELSRCMHNAVMLAFSAGVVLAFVGFFLARPLLQMMNSPENVIDRAALYMKICFLGVPASLMYNFCAAILRAHGDTSRPMAILIGTGLVNVLLNLVLVIFAKMGVAGVATATVVSQYLSAAAVLVILFSPHGDFCMRLSKVRFYWTELKKVLSVGLPCGVTSILNTLFNVFFQSIINSFGDTFMAATTAFNSILSFVYMFFNAFHSATVSFAGQNYGAKKYDRIRKLLGCAILASSVCTIALSLVVTLIPETLLSLYSDDPEVIKTAVPFLVMQSWGAISCCFGNCASGCLSGIGKTATTTTSQFICMILTRIIWVFAIFPFYPTTVMLYVCYPLAYFLCAIVQLILYGHYKKTILLQPAA